MLLLLMLARCCAAVCCAAATFATVLARRLWLAAAAYACHWPRSLACAGALVEAAEIVGVGQAIKDVSHLVVERVDVVLAAAARDCCCWYWVLRQV